MQLKKKPYLPSLYNEVNYLPTIKPMAKIRESGEPRKGTEERRGSGFSISQELHRSLGPPMSFLPSPQLPWEHLMTFLPWHGCPSRAGGVAAVCKFSTKKKGWGGMMELQLGKHHSHSSARGVTDLFPSPEMFIDCEIAFVFLPLRSVAKLSRQNKTWRLLI